MNDSQSAPMTAIALKACPFCGGDAEHICGGPGNWYVRCTSCNAATDDGMRDSTVTRWNTRAAASPRLAGREEIARIIDPHAFAQPRGIFYIAPNPDDARAALRVADAILSLLGPAPSESVGWQTIESAPRDFLTVVDLWSLGERVPDCMWMRPTYSAEKEYAWCHHAYDDSNGPVFSKVVRPTHWMPLPAPPSEVTSQDRAADENVGDKS